MTPKPARADCAKCGGSGRVTVRCCCDDPTCFNDEPCPCTSWHVRMTEDDDGSFVCTVDELPGCFASGATRSEASLNLREAIDLYQGRGGVGIPPEAPS